MSDLINRDALKEDLAKEIQTNDMGLWLKILLVIDNAPAVDISGNEYFPYRTAYFNGVADGRAATRSPGKWKRHDEWRNGEYIGGFYHVNCPCEDGYYSKWETNFCPNCGADMRIGGAE